MPHKIGYGKNVKSLLQNLTQQTRRFFFDNFTLLCTKMFNRQNEIL